MPRIARVVIPGMPHHITQRGNRRDDVFFDDADRRHYLVLAAQYAARHGLAVWAYCLMSNHVHFVAVPAAEHSLSHALRDAHQTYAARINQRLGLSGHLWQGRFYSCALDDAHLWAAVRYVERNPVRAGLVARAEDYPWSSAAAHCRKIEGLTPISSSKSESVPDLPDLPVPDLPAFQSAKSPSDLPPLLTPIQMPWPVPDWSEYLRDEDAAALAAIRRQTATGRPCGSREFVQQMEARLGRILHPQKPGPKPKTNDMKIEGQSRENRGTDSESVC